MVAGPAGPSHNSLVPIVSNIDHGIPAAKRMIDGPPWWTSMRWNLFPFVTAAASLAAYAVAAQPLDGDAASGRKIATAQCGSCHRVLPMPIPEKGDPSTADKDAPPSFQSIADLPSTTGLALNVFLHSTHRNMPNLILSGPEANDVIAYILSLKK